MRTSMINLLRENGWRVRRENDSSVGETTTTDLVLAELKQHLAAGFDLNWNPKERSHGDPLLLSEFLRDCLLKRACYCFFLQLS